jgi:type I restriction enzyme S subunit
MTKELTMEKTQLDTERSRSMPDGWELRTLGDVCEIFNGSTPLKSKREFWDDGEINWFTISDIRKQGRNIKYTQQKITSEGFNSTSITLLPKKSVLLCCTASVGEYAITDVELTTNQQFNGLVVKEKNKLFSEYLFHYSSTLKEKLLSKSGKATIDFVSMTKVKTIPIPLPPLPQQKQIVAIIDKAFAAIDTAKTNAEQNLQNAKELFESYLQNVFENKGDDWEMEKLGVLGKLTSSKRIYKKEYVSSGIPFYRSKEIKELSHNKKLSIELYISEQRYTEIKNKFGIPKEGDLLLTAVGTIGEMYIVRKNDEFYFKDGNIMWLKDFSTLNSYYLKYALTNFVERLKALSQGAAYSALTIEKLKEYSIPIPPIREQQQIVQKLDTLSAETKKLESIYIQKIVDLEEMKKSILQKAFSGELSLKVALAV